MAESNLWVQYGALGLLGVVVYYIVKNQQQVLIQITQVLEKINARQEEMLRVLSDLVKRVENIERGEK